MPIQNGRYVAPAWSNGTFPAIDAEELQAMSDSLAKLGALCYAGTWAIGTKATIQNIEKYNFFMVTMADGTRGILNKRYSGPNLVGVFPMYIMSNEAVVLYAITITDINAAEQTYATGAGASVSSKITISNSGISFSQNDMPDITGIRGLLL